MQRKVSTLNGIAIVLAVALFAFGGVFAYQYLAKSQTPNPNDQPNPNVQNSNTQTSNSETAGSPVQSQQATEDWKTYRNDEYGFEIKYFSNFNVDEEEENGITLMDYERGKQSFSVPQTYIMVQATGIVPGSEYEKFLEEGLGVKNTGSLEEKCIGPSNPDKKSYIYRKSFKNPNNVDFSYYSSYPELLNSSCAPEGCAYFDNYRTFHNKICFSVLFVRNDKAYLATKDRNLQKPEEMLSTFKFTK